MDEVKTTIYCDNRHNYYIQNSPMARDLLPDDIYSYEDRRNIKKFESAYQDITGQPLPERIRESIITSLHSVFDNCVRPIIEKYNDDILRSQITRYYKLVGHKLIEIDKLPKDAGFKADYDGEQSPEEIIAFINALDKNLSKIEYAVFECPKCHKKQYQPIKHNKVRCVTEKCSPEGIDIDSLPCDKTTKIFDQGDSATNEANAIDYLYKKKEDDKREQTETKEENITAQRLVPFYFGGNTYRFSATDCDSLHVNLYNAFAVDEILVITDNGVGFTENYRRYIKSLQDCGVNSYLYKDLKVALSHINSQEYSLSPISKAFYWFINKYCLKSVRSLFWRIDDEVVSFDNKKQFIDKLLTAKEQNRQQLIFIYEQVASLDDLENNFFQGYSGSLIELSFMIFNETGLFVYITKDLLINFGTSFIDHLHDVDDLVVTRNLFIDNIKDSCQPFWELIKGKTFEDYSDGFFESSDGTYYDKLCYYQYAIQGKRQIKYKSIVLMDSKEGFSYIKNIVRNVYLSRDERSQELYSQLIEMLRNEAFWDNDRFSILKATRDEDKKTHEIVLSFENLRNLVIQERSNIPSLGLYLKCIDTSSKNVAKTRFYYKSRLFTLVEHIKKLVEYGDTKTILNEIHQFYSNSDVICIIDEILNNTKEGGSRKFREEQDKAFNVLCQEAKKLNDELADERKRNASNEIKGVNHTRREPIKAIEIKDNNNTAKNQTKTTTEENNNDEWS